jgi:hypothetical protein
METTLVASLLQFHSYKLFQKHGLYFGILWVVLATLQKNRQFFPNHLVTLLLRYFCLSGQGFESRCYHLHGEVNWQIFLFSLDQHWKTK